MYQGYGRVKKMEPLGENGVLWRVVRGIELAVERVGVMLNKVCSARSCSTARRVAKVLGYELCKAAPRNLWQGLSASGKLLREADASKPKDSSGAPVFVVRNVLGVYRRGPFI
eukprot:CAMPEP_0115828164 /NCGR_PEP_ID=MMETSP0287-20121206/430_1 /TAXON_ID=412157 /ORGANISM="Chrysochromulina rotalis, Strain UIO044" /LENGTH=112 /DNA_ID=CAMNT_0003281367 /DNA_START=186 /DNA_END=524 /DNA_ORIENTATION=-